MNKGLFIVFEGIDGSGKTTQVELLAKYLSDRNIPFDIISFPQYGKNEHADKVHDYLLGKLGEADPYQVAKLYAADRKTIREQILNWLKDGKLVIANRYVSSSKAHMGANLPYEKREEFFKWLERLEYEENGMSKPDLTIFLKVDPKIGQKNALAKVRPDIHEKSIEHEQEAAKIYLELSQAEENWVVLDCMGNRRGLFSGENGQMKPPAEIQSEIRQIVGEKLQD